MKRSVASAVVAGSVVAAAALSGPAGVDTTPAIEARACDSAYPAGIQTALAVTLRNGVAPYGLYNVAVARVSSVGNDTVPQGKVRFSVAGTTQVVGLGNGVAMLRLPRGLAGRATHVVRAAYLPSCGNTWRPSADLTRLSVFSTDTSVRGLAARDVRRGERPRVVATIRSATLAPGGQARVRIYRGTQVRTATVDVSRVSGGTSRVVAAFGRALRPGVWTARVSYLGNRNFERSSADTTFVVRRR